MMRAIATCAAVAMALAGCAEMSAGDCTDKGTCDWIDADAVGDAAVEASLIDAGASLDATIAPDAAGDAMTSDRTVPIDAPGDAAEEADHSVPDGGGTDDGADEADRAMVDGGDAGDASEAGDAGGVVPDACTCVASAPSGWSGPVALAETIGVPPAAIAPCVSPYPTTDYDGNGDPSAPAAQCGCTCGAATDPQCPAPVVDLFSDSACSIACGGAPVDAGTCANLSTGACGASVYARARAPLPSGASCPPQPTSNVTPMQWARAARTCALPGPATEGACGASFVCTPAPSPPFSGHLCVAMAGDQPCPSGSPYGVKHVYYGGATDERGCSTCACGPPDGGSCSGSFTTFNASGCALETSTFPLSPTCDAVQIATASVEANLTAPSGGGCTPSVVQAKGALVLTQPTTVCCLP